MDMLSLLSFYKIFIIKLPFSCLCTWSLFYIWMLTCVWLLQIGKSYVYGQFSCLIDCPYKIDISLSLLHFNSQYVWNILWFYKQWGNFPRTLLIFSPLSLLHVFQLYDHFSTLLFCKIYPSFCNHSSHTLQLEFYHPSLLTTIFQFISWFSGVPHSSAIRSYAS